MPALQSLTQALRLATLLASFLLLGACKEEEAAADPGLSMIPVEVERAAHRAIEVHYTGTSTLEPRGEAQVVAKTSGVALEVFAQEGDAVKAGQVLVRIDSARAQLQAAQSAAQANKLQASYQRALELADRQLVSAADLDQLRYDLETARAAHRLALLEMSYAQVKAPIDGLVAQKAIKPGNLVQINTPIFRLVDNSHLEAVLIVPERELATLKVGQAVKLQVDALPAQEFIGTVDRVSPVVDAGSGTFRVVAAFDGNDVLQPGMFARLSIVQDLRPNALVVPRSALIDDQASSASGREGFVYTVDEGKARRTAVKLGQADGDHVEILQGLAPGDRVITAGKNAVRDESQVQVLR